LLNKLKEGRTPKRLYSYLRSEQKATHKDNFQSISSQVEFSFELMTGVAKEDFVVLQVSGEERDIVASDHSAPCTARQLLDAMKQAIVPVNS